MDRFLRACAALVLCGLLTACDTTTAQEHTDNARARLAEGQVSTAVIELKNALQKDPEHAEARLLLGEAHLELGDYPSALKELERALDLGMDNDRVRAGILRAKVHLGSYQEVIGALADQGALAPEFAVILADAYLGAGDPDRARPLYEQGRELADGQAGLGRIAWQQGDPTRATQHFARAVELDPKNWSAWLSKAEVALGEQAFDDAQAAFAAASALPASTVAGHIGLARVALGRGDLQTADNEVREVLRLAPNLPIGHYLEGLLRFQQQDLDGAENAIRQVQRTTPDHPPSLYLMGAIKYAQRHLAQAEDNLVRYLSSDPDNTSAAKLLAAARFDQGNYAGAAEALAPIVDGSDDPQLLAMYGTAQMHLRNTEAAVRALERSVELAPDAAAFRNQLAVSLLASGDRAGAEAELESAIAVDGEQFQSDYLLALLRIREQQWDEAAESVDALVQKQPDSPVGYNLRGALALARQDPEAARAAFREALAKDPAFLPAVQNLARIEERDGHRDRAAALYREFLETNENHEGALLSLAELAMRDGDSKAAIGHLEQALEANPGSVRSSVGLARLYLSAGRVAEAREVVDTAVRLAPDQPDLLLLRAEVHLRSGNVAAARQVASRLQSRLASGEGNPALALALGRLQAQAGQPDLARANLERVLEQAEGRQPAALHLLARLDLTDRKLEEARARLDELRAIAPEQPETRLLEADLTLAEGDLAEAEAAYGQLADDGVREAVMRLATIRLQQGQVDRALERLESWLGGHPSDLGAQLLAADALMRRDKDRALARYEGLADTGNPVVLNNLAWLYMEKNDPRAASVARRAVEAAPNSAEILDTFGWILLKQEKNAAEAVRVLRQSVQLAPDNPSVQYHLGIALREAGDSAGARAALERALEKDGFPEADEARAALAAL
ncbi:MAG TPA: XrtA/PEP-CTERM system TPR-repeat protein PrsT [Pseudomonadales bacterium]